MAVAPVYQYHKLRNQEVRLLDLLPGRFEDEICCFLRPVKLDPERPPTYHALSYAWGNPERTTSITIVSHTKQYKFGVTENLYTALQHLRFQDTSRTLWIDAICINQQDVQERNTQVARVADVFRSAAQINVNIVSNEITMSDSSEINESLLDHLGPLPFDDVTLESLNSLLIRPWFSRLWIWQETYLAQNRAHLMCGYDTMSCHTFGKALVLLTRKTHAQEFPGLYNAIMRAQNIIISSHFQTGIQRVLDITRDAKCSDERDRVFGVLHLVEKSYRLVIRPNYANSTVDVFKDLVLRLALDHGDLSLLTSCELRAAGTKLPSWVPDWSLPRTAPILIDLGACWNAGGLARYSDG